MGVKLKHVVDLETTDVYKYGKDTARCIRMPNVPTVELATASTANKGAIAYDTTLDALYYSDGAAWQAVSITAGVGSLQQVTTAGATSNVVDVKFTGASSAANSLEIGDGTDHIDFYALGGDCFMTTVGSADLTIAPDGGNVTVTGDFDASGDVKGATVTCTGALSADSATITGAIAVGSIELDAIAAATAAATLKVDGNGAGGVNICSISTGGITLSDDTTLAASKVLTLTGVADANEFIMTAGDAVLSDGSLAITDADNAPSFVLTNNTYTNGAGGLVDINASGVITGQVINVVANGVTSGSMVYLETSAASFTGKYIQCYDGANDDFSVGLYGATIIAGNAAGTAALTVSAGDLKLTAGAIDEDCVTDVANVFTRNCAATTKDFVQIVCSNASDDECALSVTHAGTAGVPAVEVTSAGTDDALKVTVSDAGGTALQCISGAGTDSLVKLNGTTGHWVGAANVGMLDIDSDGTPADVAASLVNLTLTGSGILLGEGNCLRIVDSSTAATSHSVYIASTNNEALWVDAGKARFDEGILVGSGATGYVSSLGAYDLVLRTNEGTNSGTITIEDGSAGTISIAPNTTGRVSFPGPAQANGTAFTAVPQLVGMPFVAGSFDGNDDLAISASMPKSIILDYWVTYSTEEAITLILRDAANGGGNEVAAAIDITAAGPLITRTTEIVTPAMAATGTLFVHASGNPAAAVGTVYVMYMEVA